MKISNGFILLSLLGAVTANSHHNRFRNHQLKRQNTSSGSSSTSSSSSSTTSGSSSSSSSLSKGTTGTGGTFDHIPNSSDIPIGSILPGQNLSGKTMNMPTTASPGQVPFSGAPPLPSSSPSVSEYPEMDAIPPVDHPFVQEWISQIDWTKVPDWSQTKDGSCDSDPDLVKEADASQRCWWTCGGCTADDDLVSCPNKYDWGLSYDDGPSPYSTTLLNYLAQQKVTSTFFIVGSRALSRPDMLRAELVLGHQLSVHTWSHPYLTTLTNEELVAELGWTKKIIQEVTGLTPNTMRPPYGDMDNRVREVCRQMSLTPIIWTTGKDSSGKSFAFDTNDWKIAGGDVSSNKSLETFEKILDSSKDIDTGFIVLQHDLYQQSVELAVAYVLPEATTRTPKLNLMSVIDCLQKPQTEAYIETSANNTAPYEVGTNQSSAVKNTVNYIVPLLLTAVLSTYIF